MLILSRKQDESIVIDGRIEVKIISAEDGRVRVGVAAPRDVEIHRKEIFDQIQKENEMAANPSVEISRLKDLIK